MCLNSTRSARDVSCQKPADTPTDTANGHGQPRIQPTEGHSQQRQRTDRANGQSQRTHPTDTTNGHNQRTHPTDTANRHGQRTEPTDRANGQSQRTEPTDRANGQSGEQTNVPDRPIILHLWPSKKNRSTPWLFPRMLRRPQLPSSLARR